MGFENKCINNFLHVFSSRNQSQYWKIRNFASEVIKNFSIWGKNRLIGQTRKLYYYQVRMFVLISKSVISQDTNYKFVFIYQFDLKQLLNFKVSLVFKEIGEMLKIRKRLEIML